VSGKLARGMEGSNLSSLMNFCASGFMLAISGAGCPAATTTTSTDLSPNQLDQRFLVREEARIRFGNRSVEHHPVQGSVIRAARCPGGPVDLAFAMS